MSSLLSGCEQLEIRICLTSVPLASTAWHTTDRPLVVQHTLTELHGKCSSSVGLGHWQTGFRVFGRCPPAPYPPYVLCFVSLRPLWRGLCFHPQWHFRERPRSRRKWGAAPFFLLAGSCLPGRDAGPGLQPLSSRSEEAPGHLRGEQQLRGCPGGELGPSSMGSPSEVLAAHAPLLPGVTTSLLPLKRFSLSSMF